MMEEERDGFGRWCRTRKRGTGDGAEMNTMETPEEEEKAERKKGKKKQRELLRREGIDSGRYLRRA
jgi:hypothetical protein